MQQFHYKALSVDGRMIRGKLRASSRSEVIAELRKRQQYPVSTSVDAPGLPTLSKLATGSSNRPLNGLILANFVGALAPLLQAGVPLARALELLVGLRDFYRIRARISAVAGEIRGGATLADALQRDAAFSRFIVSMVRAGESGGKLSETLTLVARYLERTNATREAIVSALIYPVFLAVTTCLSIGVIMAFVVPAFAPLFESAHKALPFGAALLLTLSNFLTGFWWAALLAIVSVAILLRQTIRNAEIAKIVDRRVLRVPLLGSLVSRIEAEKFCRVLSTLLANSVSLPIALDHTKDVLGNLAFKNFAGEATLKVREGAMLSALLENSRLFPDGTVDFLRIGEESGDVPGALARQADLLARTVKASIDRALGLLVPVMTIGLGIIVGTIIATLLTAILSINELAI